MHHVKQETRAVEAKILFFKKSANIIFNKFIRFSALLLLLFRAQGHFKCHKKLANIFSLLFILYCNCIASFIGHLSDQ